MLGLAFRISVELGDRAFFIGSVCFTEKRDDLFVVWDQLKHKSRKKKLLLLLLQIVRFQLEYSQI